MTQRTIDPERDPTRNPFDTGTGDSGQEYTRERERELGRPEAAIGPMPGEGDRDVPPDNGARAVIDRATGEVHGSGVGTGGGQAGEDFDSDPASGDGYPLTGSEGTDKIPGDLGPGPSGR